MRDRLIEMLDKAFLESEDNYGIPNMEQVADYLISNGVIVPPCMIGDTLYSVKPKFFVDRIAKVYVKGFSVFIESNSQIIPIDRIGKDLFFTESEAEKSIK